MSDLRVRLFSSRPGRFEEICKDVSFGKCTCSCWLGSMVRKFCSFLLGSMVREHEVNAEQFANKSLASVRPEEAMLK